MDDAENTHKPSIAALGMAITVFIRARRGLDVRDALSHALIAAYAVDFPLSHRPRIARIGCSDEAERHLDVYNPGHTDLMVSPESIDAFLEANPLPPEPPVSDGMTQAARDVLAERQRQIAKGWTADHDDYHMNSEIINEWFGAKERLWKATLKSPPDRQLLVEAAAQVIAEIERLDRIPAAPKGKESK